MRLGPRSGHGPRSSGSLRMHASRMRGLGRQGSGHWNAAGRPVGRGRLGRRQRAWRRRGLGFGGAHLGTMTAAGRYSSEREPSAATCGRGGACRSGLWGAHDAACPTPGRQFPEHARTPLGSFGLPACPSPPHPPTSPPRCSFAWPPSRPGRTAAPRAWSRTLARGAVRRTASPADTNHVTQRAAREEQCLARRTRAASPAGPPRNATARRKAQQRMERA